VVVHDEGSHSVRGEIGVVELTDTTQMVLSTEGLSEELLTSTGRKKHHRVAEVDNGHPTTVIKAPAMANGRWHGHLSACGDQKFGANSHNRSSSLGGIESYKVTHIWGYAGVPVDSGAENYETAAVLTST
jgi:hypothetical protein